ncbi:DNA glycosylase [Russula emetica]|nr:DNA glycosylase [Russula emetica]
MPLTRSITRARAATTPPVVNVKRAPKRQSESKDPVVTTKRSRTSNSKPRAKKTETEGTVPRPLIESSGEELAPIPAKLIFSLEDAKNHLIRADHRFRDMFSRLPDVRPFRLNQVCSAQQISWMAARAILHKFLKVYFPELPDKPDDQHSTETQDKFPTAYQVATTDLATLRTVGLSGRKAEYVRDLATRFADGRLSNQKLLDANDEELFDLLTAVYGIGKMFAIFSLQRPDILPVGDLGVQRGLLRWTLSLHQPGYGIELSPKKHPDSKPKPTKSRKNAKAKGGVSTSNEIMDSDQEVEQEADELPSLNGLPEATAAASPTRRLDQASMPPPQDATSVLPSVSTTKSNPLSLGTSGALGLPSMPSPLTPSVTRVLAPALDAPPPPPLPAGLTIASLRSRLDGKKKIKGAILTPSEMQALTEPWRPYRSIGRPTFCGEMWILGRDIDDFFYTGVYYMWRLAEEKAAS